MIVAHQFGWSAVSDAPMDWAEYQLALELLTQERAGRRARQVKAEEDAEFQASRKALRG